MKKTLLTEKTSYVTPVISTVEISEEAPILQSGGFSIDPADEFDPFA